MANVMDGGFLRDSSTHALVISGFAGVANTFTKAQTVTPDVTGTTALTLASDPATYALDLKDRVSAKSVVKLGNVAGGSGRAGAMALYGDNGLGTDGLAWSLGVDVASTPSDKDFFVAKINGDNSATDVFYIHNNGASGATTEMPAAGASYPVTATLSVNGVSRASGDPVLFHVRPTIDQVLNAIEVLRLDTTTNHAPEAFATFRVHGDPTKGIGLGSGAAAVDSTIVRTSGGGLRIGFAATGAADALFVENTHTPKANGDIARLSFASDGFGLVRMEADYNSGSAAGGYTLFVNNNGTWGAKFRADINGVGFFAKAVAGSTVGPSAASAAVAVTASTQTTPWGYSTQAQADGIVTLVNNLRNEIRALGFLT